ncbi:MAG: DUF1549 and DUF1553 domain-containing protein [Pirellulaceae bacterium]|jgi:hypothetical protein|nr:DUF1549 and DUF1553 domain-containing protein [Pirellulaceae bacterium]MDP7015522.1 DUF1549 and DUF1553 domain-containing protein [Pirellulaceae bacterium]
MRYASLLIPLLLSSAAVAADDLIPPAAERFSATADEVPDFQRHIMPLMGRLGCNGRACHGSFQGRGGLRLSLFGYDPKMDHEALTKVETDSGETLVNLKSPDDSPLIQYPTDADSHEGGERFEKGSWVSHLLDAWMRGKALGIEKPQRLVQLEVLPSELVFAKPGEESQLQVIAHWDDGSKEDVTCLARFKTNNEAIAEIDENGRVVVMGRGDTHVVAFYDNGVTAVPVLTPVNELTGDKYPQVAVATKVDELVVAKLRKLGVIPSDVCSDGAFLRRVSLDIAGTLPTADEAAAFLADSSPDKRSRKIDELLERPAYAAWWATKFCDLTGNNPQNMGEASFRNEQSQQWYRWVYARLAENSPYDELVAGIIVSQGRAADQSYDEYAEEMTSYVRTKNAADFSQRKTMPHYWARRTFRTPEDRALGVAYAFLGIRIQCAQCHKHPFDQWTQDDFKQFTGFFRGVTYGVSPKSREDYNEMQESLGLRGKNGGEIRRMMAKLARDGKTVPFRELFVAGPPRKNNNRSSNNRRRSSNARAVSAKLLAAEVVDLTKQADPRAPVMEWMRRKDNAYFSRALVNRVWAHYFHAGIIDPPDDLNLANPPSNRALLAHLSQGFIESGYDLKWVHREIANSDTYQRSWRANETNLADRRNFSRAVPRRLPAEVAYDALVQATASSSKLASLAADPMTRAISHSSVRGGATRYAMTVFGKPSREQTCDCERSDEPTLLQSVYLQNDRDVQTMIDRGGWLTELARQLKEPAPGGQSGAAGQIANLQRQIRQLRNQGKKKRADELARRLNALRKRQAAGTTSNKRPADGKQRSSDVDHDELIRVAFLRTVTRTPNEDELADARSYLADSDSTVSGVRDLLWALLNTKEFVVNH